MPQVKILVALRQDLLEIVFDRTRDAGFQEEKYEAYLLPLQWTENELEQLIERRVNEVFRRQYTKDNVKFLDIFPSPKNSSNESETAIKYIISHTLLRPRDVLQYVNECFVVASGRERVSWQSIQTAEATYSSKRLKSLQEEWGNIYPALKEAVNILRGLPHSFIRSDINSEKLESVCMSLNDMNLRDTSDPCVKACKKLYSPGENITESDVVSELLQCFYHVGIIGIKISTLDPFIWSYLDQSRVSKSEIKRANQIKIHKMLHHTLEIRGSR